MNVSIGVCNPAAALLLRVQFRLRQEGESGYGIISRLFFHEGIVQGSAIYARRGTGFEACSFKPECYELLCEALCAFFTDAATALVVSAYVNGAIQEGTGSDDDRLSLYLLSGNGLYSGNCST